MDLYTTHVAAMVPFGVFLPKHHVVFHLLDDMTWFGNTVAYANWQDEALNRNLKALCKSCSQLSFEPTLLLRARGQLRALYEEERFKPRPQKRKCRP